MAQTEFEDVVEILRNYLEDFKKLEQQEPEIAERLGFAGFTQFMDTRLYQNERFGQLERMASDVADLRNLAQQ
jgi:hypothetical protein